MKIPHSLKEQMYLAMALGAFCQLAVDAKPELNSSSSNSTDSAISASKTGAPATQNAANGSTNRAPAVNADERRRALRERFEKMRKNPNLRRETVNGAHKKGSSLEPKSLQTSEAIKARECVECGRG